MVKNAGAEFAEYFEDTNVPDFMPGRDLYELYKTATKDEISAQTFYGRIRRMCGIYEWKFETRGKGTTKEIRIVKNN